MAWEEQGQRLCDRVERAVLTRMRLFRGGQDPDSAAFEVVPKTSAVGSLY